MYKSLESLRIISALLVVAAHLSPTSMPIATWFFGGSLFLGSIGVDVFFIISGIVMGLAFQKRHPESQWRPRVSGFLASRLRKIYPLYILATLLAVAIAPLFGRGFPDATKFVLDLVLAPHQQEGRYIDPIIGAGWTLRYEIFFYLVVLLGLFVNRRHFVTLMIGIVALGLPIGWGYYGTLLLFEFLAGYLLADHLARLKVPGSTPLRVLGLVSAAALFLLSATGKDFPPAGEDLATIPRMLIFYGDLALPRVLAWGVPSLLLVIATVSLERQVPTRLAAFGKYTYSLYLMQYFCLPVEHKLLARGWPELLALAATLCALALVTWLSYRFVEKPFSAPRRRAPLPTAPQASPSA